MFPRASVFGASSVGACMRRHVLVLGLLVCGLLASPAHAMVSMCNVPITMSDGAVLRANIFLPGDGTSRVPTVLTATGYNKDATNPTGQSCGTSGALATVNQSLVDHGMAAMLLDDRGTGASQGRWDSWGQRTQDDYSDVLDWVQAQKWSNGKVGTTGGSYMGITSLLIAEKDAERVAHGKPRAVRAIWAEVPMADAYRDVTFHGGATDTGFMPLWLGLTPGLSDLPPSDFSSDPSAAQTYAGHLQNGLDFAAAKLVDTTTGGDSADDRPFYPLRADGGRRSGVRGAVLPPALPGRADQVDPRAGRVDRRLVGHLPARRAAALRADDQRAGQEVLDDPAVPRRPGRDDLGRAEDRRRAGRHGQVVPALPAGRRQRRREAAAGQPLHDGCQQVAAPVAVAGAGREAHAVLPRRRRQARRGEAIVAER